MQPYGKSQVRTTEIKTFNKVNQLPQHTISISFLIHIKLAIKILYN